MAVQRYADAGPAGPRRRSGTASAHRAAPSRRSWAHNTRHLDWQAKYNDVGGGFRADTGFVPQVGYREANAYAGWTVHPSGFVSMAARS